MSGDSDWENFSMNLTFIVLDHSENAMHKIRTFRRETATLISWKDSVFDFPLLTREETFEEGLDGSPRYVKDGKIHLIVALSEAPLEEEIHEPLQSSVNEIAEMTLESEMITLRISNGVELHAEKKILSEGSAWFRRKFEQDTELKTVEIVRFSQETVKELLRFLSMGKVKIDFEIEEENEIELYKAAKVYEVVELQEICLKFFKSGVYHENVFDILLQQFAIKDDELVDHYNYCLEIISM